MVVVVKDIVLKLLSILHTTIAIGISTTTEDMVFAILWKNIRIEGT